MGSHRVLSSLILYVFFLDLNSLGPDDGPVRTETCSPTANKVYIGHLLVVLDGYTNYTYTYNFVLCSQTRQLGQSDAIDCDIWPDAVSLVSWYYCRRIHFIYFIVEVKRVTCSNTGQTRIRWKEQQGGIYTVGKDYCYNVMADLC